MGGKSKNVNSAALEAKANIALFFRPLFTIPASSTGVSHEIGNADLQSRNLLMPKTPSVGGVSARIRCIKDC